MRKHLDSVLEVQMSLSGRLWYRYILLETLYWSLLYGSYSGGVALEHELPWPDLNKLLSHVKEQDGKSKFAGAMSSKRYGTRLYGGSLLS